MKRGSKDPRGWERGGNVTSQDRIAQRARKRRLLRTGIFGLVVGLLCLSAEPVYALGCGNRLVLVGASTAEVLNKCGEPVARDQWVEYRTVPQRFSLAAPQEQIYLPVTIEEWVYNFGAQRFMQQFHFEDGRLSDIEAVGYGG
jgi:hypothetical protein